MDRVTRGVTRAGRLARLDRWVVERGLLDGADRPLVVDVGIGAEPVTTLELWAALRGRWPGVELVGTDLDPERVAHAQASVEPGLRVVLAGFDLELDRPATLIRAMNVLRQYKPDQVADAHRRLGAALAEGGWLLDGTCGRSGDVLGCLVLRKVDGALVRQALVLGVDGTRGFAPLMLRDRLPRDLRDRGNPPHPMGAFLRRWTDAWQAVRSPDDPPLVAFSRSAEALAQRGETLDLRWVEQGLVVWEPDGGVPAR